jgi:hypothetical protein
MPEVALRDEPLARRSEFSKKAGASALLHFLGELPHGFLRDHAAFTTRKGGFRIIQRERKCSSLAFAFFPQSEASCTASSSVCNRPLSMARRANAFLGPM